MFECVRFVRILAGLTGWMECREDIGYVLMIGSVGSASFLVA